MAFRLVYVGLFDFMRVIIALAKTNSACKSQIG